MQKSPVDPTLLNLERDELAFFKAQTGIEDTNRLRAHILEVQAKAYEAFPYPCIRRFLFTKRRIAQLPGYEHVMQLGKTRQNAIFLDAGCCFGHEIRAVIADGYPSGNMIGTDLHRDLWDFGHKLFNSNSATFPVPFIEGDIFDSAILDLSVARLPDQPSLLHLGNSLTPLLGHVSVIHATMFFHVFPEEGQLDLAHRFAALLSPLPGSIIFGNHIGLPSKGIHPNNPSGKRMFCHSPESFRAMWEQVFGGKESVDINVELVKADEVSYSYSKKEGSTEFYGRDTDERHRDTQWLNWNVKRI
ncbi:hypothetical protein K439DRAFT_1384828 [Ramaria rubella]|nr:hypothetical protein K439DRAFT_1384828 [Ramaria rubella]